MTPSDPRDLQTSHGHRSYRDLWDASGTPEEVSATAAESTGEASEHYQRGNRLYEQKDWERARGEWQQAATLWQPGSDRRPLPDRLGGVRAVLLLLSTVLAAYYLIFTYFPRDPFEMFLSGMASQVQGEERSWWEQFLDTGRPSSNDRHKLGIREWWDRLSERLWAEQQLAQGERFLPSIDERWAELLRRYNRWGPLIGHNIDYQIVASQGLTTQGVFDEAVAILQRGIAGTNDAAQLGELYQSLATTYYFQGYTLQRDQLANYDLELVRRSAEAYEQSLRYQPRVLSYGNLGWAYFLIGEYELAERSSLRALSYDENLEYVRLNLGLIYLVQDRYKPAFTAYRRVTALNPPPEAYLGGISDLKEVIRDNPGRYPFAHLMAGYLNIHRGDLPAARRDLSDFLAASDTAEEWRALARLWLRDPSAAREY